MSQKSDKLTITKKYGCLEIEADPILNRHDMEASIQKFIDTYCSIETDLEYDIREQRYKGRIYVTYDTKK